MKLAGKVALVTGSSQGIGAAIAVRLAGEGADIVVNYHSHPEEADAVKAKIAGLGRRGGGLAREELLDRRGCARGHAASFFGSKSP